MLPTQYRVGSITHWHLLAGSPCRGGPLKSPIELVCSDNPLRVRARGDADPVKYIDRAD